MRAVVYGQRQYPLLSGCMDDTWDRQKLKLRGVVSHREKCDTARRDWRENRPIDAGFANKRAGGRDRRSNRASGSINRA